MSPHGHHGYTFGMIARGAQGNSSGHTLPELLIVLAVLGICTLIPALSMVSGLDALRVRSGAQLWQGAVAAGQMGAIWGVEDVEVSQLADGLHVSGESGANVAAVSFPEDMRSQANISRWSGAEGASLQLGTPFGAPNGAGSVYVGAAERRARVVIRAESGLTWRAVE